MVKSILMASVLVLSSLALASEPIIINVEESHRLIDCDGVLNVETGFALQKDGRFGILLFVRSKFASHGGVDLNNLRYNLEQGVLYTEGNQMFLQLDGHEPILVAQHKWWYGRWWKTVPNVQIKVDIDTDMEVATFKPYLVIWP